MVKIIALDIRRTQHIILGLLWYSIGSPVVLKGDLLWYLLHHTSAFSVPSWILYLVGTKLLNTINLICSLSNGWVAQWIIHCLYTSKASGSTPVGWDFFLFIVVLFWCVSFLFLNIGSVLQHQFIRKYLNVTFDIKPKKVWTYFLIWDYY